MTLVKPVKKNYVNNRDLLKEIHLSKNSYCSFLDPQTDHQYDLIVPNVEKINIRAIEEARQNRAERIKRDTGTAIDPESLDISELVFRVTCWDHIPLAQKKTAKVTSKKQHIQDILEFEDQDDYDDIIDSPDAEYGDKHVWLNFPPFWHYRLNSDRHPVLVGKSHWKGDFEDGEFSIEHGQMTRKLASMFIMLCERYATRSNWRGYTYNDEFKGQALLQLSMVGLKFDESKSQNPFAYYTAAITNSFTRILNLEKRMQNMRDDILEENGLSPSWTRQNSLSKINAPGEVTITRYTNDSESIDE